MTERRNSCDRVQLLDGGVSSLLLTRYQVTSTPPAAAELLALHAPSEVLRLHEAYVLAGAEYVTTNTFGANRFRFRELGYERQLPATWRRAVELARHAADRRARVLGSIGPIAYYAHRAGSTDWSVVTDAYREVARALLDAGCDAIVLETMPTAQETIAAIEAVAPLIPADIPLVVSCYFRRTGDGFVTLDNWRAERVLEAALCYPVYAAGANCCVGPTEMTRLLRQLQPLGQGRWWAKPNAGLPRRSGKRLVYPIGPEAFAAELGTWLALGAGFVGGCCGAGPEHVRALARKLRELNRQP